MNSLPSLQSSYSQLSQRNRIFQQSSQMNKISFLKEQIQKNLQNDSRIQHLKEMKEKSKYQKLREKKGLNEFVNSIPSKKKKWLKAKRSEVNFSNSQNESIVQNILMNKNVAQSLTNLNKSSNSQLEEKLKHFGSQNMSNKSEYLMHINDKIIPQLTNRSYSSFQRYEECIQIPQQQQLLDQNQTSQNIQQQFLTNFQKDHNCQILLKEISSMYNLEALKFINNQEKFNKALKREKDQNNIIKRNIQMANMKNIEKRQNTTNDSILLSAQTSPKNISQKQKEFENHKISKQKLQAQRVHYSQSVGKKNKSSQNNQNQENEFNNSKHMEYQRLDIQLNDQLTYLIEALDISESKGIFIRQIQNQFQQQNQEQKDVILETQIMNKDQEEEIQKQNQSSSEFLRFTSIKMQNQYKGLSRKELVMKQLHFTLKNAFQSILDQKLSKLKNENNKDRKPIEENENLITSRSQQQVNLDSNQQTTILQNWLYQCLECIFNNPMDTVPDKIFFADEAFNLCFSEIVKQVEGISNRMSGFLRTIWYVQNIKIYYILKGETISNFRKKKLKDDYNLMERVLKKRNQKLLDEQMLKFQEKEFKAQEEKKESTLIKDKNKFYKKELQKMRDKDIQNQKIITMLQKEVQKLISQNEVLNEQQLRLRDQMMIKDMKFQTQSNMELQNAIQEFRLTISNEDVEMPTSRNNKELHQLNCSKIQEIQQQVYNENKIKSEIEQMINISPDLLQKYLERKSNQKGCDVVITVKQGEKNPMIVEEDNDLDKNPATDQKSGQQVILYSKSTQLDRKQYYYDFPKRFFSQSSQTELSLVDQSFDNFLIQSNMSQHLNEFRIKHLFANSQFEIPNFQILLFIKKLQKLIDSNQFINPKLNMKDYFMNFQSQQSPIQQPTIESNEQQQKPIIIQKSQSEKYDLNQSQVIKLQKSTSQIQNQTILQNSLTSTNLDEKPKNQTIQNEKNKNIQKKQVDLQQKQKSSIPIVSVINNNNSPQKNLQKSQSQIMSESTLKQNNNVKQDNSQQIVVDNQKKEEIFFQNQQIIKEENINEEEDFLQSQSIMESSVIISEKDASPKNVQQTQKTFTQQSNVTVTAQQGKGKTHGQNKKTIQIEENQNNIFKGELAKGINMMINLFKTEAINNASHQKQLSLLINLVLNITQFVEQKLLGQLFEVYRFSNAEQFELLIVEYRKLIKQQIPHNSVLFNNLLRIFRQRNQAEINKKRLQLERENKKEEQNEQKQQLQQNQKSGDEVNKQVEKLEQQEQQNKLVNEQQNQVQQQISLQSYVEEKSQKKQKLDKIDKIFASLIQKNSFLTFKINLKAEKDCYLENQNNHPGEKIAQKLKCIYFILLLLFIIQEAGRQHDFKNHFPISMILTYISEIIIERVTQRNNQLTKNLKLTIFTFNIFKQKFQFSEIVQQKYSVFILSLIKHSNIIRINTFCRLLNILDDELNYNDIESNLYFEAYHYLTNNIIGNNVPFFNNEIRQLIAKVRACELLTSFNLQSQFNIQEVEGINLFIEKSSEAHKTNKEGVIDIDIYLIKLLEYYRKLMLRTNKHVISAFNATDLDGNKMVDANEFLLLMRHIEIENFKLYGIEKCIAIYQINCDLCVNEYRMMSYNKFVQLCINYKIFTNMVQNKFLEIDCKRDVSDFFDQLEQYFVQKSSIVDKLQKERQINYLKQQSVEKESIIQGITQDFNQQLEQSKLQTQFQIISSQQEDNENVQNIGISNSPSLNQTISQFSQKLKLDLLPEKNIDIQELNQEELSFDQLCKIIKEIDNFNSQIEEKFQNLSKKWEAEKKNMEWEIEQLRQFVEKNEVDDWQKILDELDNRIIKYATVMPEKPSFTNPRPTKSKSQNAIRVHLAEKEYVEKYKIYCNELSTIIKPILISFFVMKKEIERIKDLCQKDYHENNKYNEVELWQIGLLSNRLNIDTESTKLESLI